MKKEYEFKVLKKDFGLRFEETLPNGNVIKVYDSDPYFYAKVIDKNTGTIIDETEPFLPKNLEKIVKELKEKYE